MMSSFSFSAFRNLMVQSTASRFQPLVRSLTSCDEERFRSLLENFQGGSVDLKKNEENGIATLLVNNPTKKNALTGKMLLDLEANINELEKWTTGKGLILAGVDGTFCSGGDRDLVEVLGKFDGVLMSEFMHTITNKLFNMPLVSVAVINGYALGGGACLATACDFRIMSSSAKIGFVQVRMNVSPGWGGGARLVKLVGRSKALELMISGRLVDSKLAQECGLANEVIPDNNDIIEEGENWLHNSLRGNADTIQVLKRLVATAADNDMTSSLAAERVEFSKLWASPLHLEAFRKKTKHKK